MGGGTNRHPQDPKTTVEDNIFTIEGPQIYLVGTKDCPSPLLSSDLSRLAKRSFCESLKEHGSTNLFCSMSKRKGRSALCICW